MALSIHSYGTWKSKIKMPSDLVTPEASLFSLPPSCRVLIWSCLCACAFLSLPFLTRKLGILDQGPTLMILFILNYFHKSLISNTVAWAIRAFTYGWGGVEGVGRSGKASLSITGNTLSITLSFPIRLETWEITGMVPMCPSMGL